jgi:hypothetical protein
MPAPNHDRRIFHSICLHVCTFSIHLALNGVVRVLLDAEGPSTWPPRSKRSSVDLDFRIHDRFAAFWKNQSVCTIAARCMNAAEWPGEAQIRTRSAWSVRVPSPHPSGGRVAPSERQADRRLNTYRPVIILYAAWYLLHQLHYFIGERMNVTAYASRLISERLCHSLYMDVEHSALSG